MDFNEETVWVTHYTESGKKYCITSDEFRRMYHLWREENGKMKFKHEAEDPTDLYKYCKD